MDHSNDPVNELRRIRYGSGSAVPIAKINANPTSSSQLNTIYTFTGAGSYDPGGKLPLAYEWDFGDGAKQTTSIPTATHQYASAGKKTVRLVVKNGDAPPKVSSPALVDVFPGQRRACWVDHAHQPHCWRAITVSSRGHMAL